MFPAHPCSDTGQLQSEISVLRNKVNGKADDYEIHEINSKLNSMEHSIGEIETKVDDFLYQLQELQHERSE